MGTPQTVTGAQFKQMLMKAGHTKGYVSAGVKKVLHEMKLDHTGGVKASSALYNQRLHVNKRDATRIIGALKEKHLAHAVTTSAKKFVYNAYEQAHKTPAQTAATKPDATKPDVNADKHATAREDMLKRQHLGDRAREIAAENAAQTGMQSQKTGTTAKPSMGAVPLLSHDMIPSVQRRPGQASPQPLSPNATDPVHATESTAPTEQGPNIESVGKTTLTEAPEEIIDLAID